MEDTDVDLHDETQAPTDTEVSEALSDSSPETETQDEELETKGAEKPEEPKKSGVERRIGEMTWKQREAERQAEAARQEAEYWKAKAQEKAPEKPKTLEDFDYDETAYNQHLMNEVEQKAKLGAVEEARRILQEEQQRSEAIRKRTTFESGESKYAESVDDYYEVARADSLPVNQTMADVITDMELGPAVLYYLGKNPDIAYQISNLSDIGAARELGKIEAKLSAKPSTPTNAPPPPSKIGGVESGINEDPENMSVEKWLKWREKQLAKR